MFEGKSVLIVDDNQTNRILLKKRLTFLGMTVHEASGGEEAWNLLLQKSDFHLAILDLMMPEMDGVTLARKMKENSQTKEIPLVLLSSIGKGDLVEQGGREFFVSILQKPLHLSRFHETLEEVLGQTDQLKSGNALSAPQVAPVMVGQKILVVEDNEANRRLICKMLEKEGYSSDQAANGADAVVMMKRNRYRIILMDIQMPQMGGLEATRLIREHEIQQRETRRVIVALTANALVGDRENYIAQGMNDYLSKPIKKSEFLAVLDQYGSKNLSGAD